MNPRTSRMPGRRTLQRFMKFGLVGGTGVLVDMGVVFLLGDPRMFNWELTLSKTVAAETAILNNFIWNDLWTFQDLSANNTDWHARIRRFFKFNLVCLAGIAINVLLLSIQVHALRMNVYVANFIAIFLISIWNFFMNLKFGWGGGGANERRSASSLS